MQTETKNTDNRNILLAIFIGIAFVSTLVQLIIGLKYWETDLGHITYDTIHYAFQDTETRGIGIISLWCIIGIIQAISLILPALVINKKPLKIIGIIFAALMTIIRVYVFYHDCLT